jgi:hypothetical protein
MCTTFLFTIMNDDALNQWMFKNMLFWIFSYFFFDLLDLLGSRKPNFGGRGP